METGLTIAVTSTPPDKVRSARIGIASHLTSMGMEVLELITSVGILTGSPMPGAILWRSTADGSFVILGHVLNATWIKVSPLTIKKSTNWSMRGLR